MTTAAGNSVEVIDNLRERFDHMVIGEVVKLKPHPHADRLKVAEVKLGMMKTADIVCGGANLQEGQKVVVAEPGAKVRWHGEGDLVELHETEIRGVKSHGMICAANELGFEKYPQGEKDIWVVNDLTDAKAGTPIADALELDDHYFDIEVTTNRPDCKSIIGQAREGSAVTGDRFTWEQKTVPLAANPRPLKVELKDQERCKKYEAVMIDGVKVGPSPWWLQKRLLLAGHRPINNVVDVTNYVLHEYGQPLHAFDADKLETDEIVIRPAEHGETIVALDGESYELNDQMLVIADIHNPVAIAGVMGGEKSGTTEDTTRVIIESATFDPVSIRRTSRKLNLSSDSSQLFEKGLSTEATAPALARAVELILEIAGGEVVSAVASVRAQTYTPKTIDWDPARTRALIGVDIPEEQMVAMLQHLGFGLVKEGERFVVTVPYWRDKDIEQAVDFTEEIARLFGYANVPSILPTSEAIPSSEDPAIVWERRVKEALRGAGLTETYGYSFISEKELAAYHLPTNSAVRLQNPLASDQEYLRPSLFPSMLTTIEKNQRLRPEAQLFELAPVYTPSREDIPHHELHLLIAMTGKDGYQNFRKAKGVLERLMREMGMRDWQIDRAPEDDRWHPGRSGQISMGEHEIIGIIGEVSSAVAEAADLDYPPTLLSLDMGPLVKVATTAKSYEAIPLYPAVKRDLAILVPEKTEFSSLLEKMKGISGFLRDVELFDIYRGKGVDTGSKSLAMHLSFRLADRTLESDEVDQELQKIRGMLEKDFSAIMRS